MFAVVQWFLFFDWLCCVVVLKLFSMFSVFSVSVCLRANGVSSLLGCFHVVLDCFTVSGDLFQLVISSYNVFNVVSGC